MAGFEFSSVFYEISVLVLLAAVLGLAGLSLRQPLVVAFIAAGILAGPDVLGLVQSDEFITLLSQISIAVLLFLVGLKLDVNLVRNLGAVSVATGLGQVTFTAAIGFALCLIMGIDWLTAVYVAVALTFSSTIIIVKLLSDKQEIDALHGKIALGFLIVQDIFVVLAMVVVSAIGLGEAEGEGGGSLIVLMLGALAMLAFVYVFIRYLANGLLQLVARSSELLVIFAVGWAAGFAAIADWIGLGKELGGLLAGVSLASTPMRDAIGARLASLRDFLLLFFFLSLGAGLDLSTLGAQLGPAAVLSVFVLIGNPLIVLAIMGFMGYRKRTGFLAGLTVAQISEFSLIFMAMGLSLGHVTEGAMGLVTLVGLVTIALSVYMITWSHKLYALCEPLLGVFERRKPFRELEDDTPDRDRGTYDFIILGLGRYGCRIGQGLKSRGYRLLGVDFDPQALRHWRGFGLDARFGDATDPEFLAHLPLNGVKGVISAVPRSRGPLSEADGHAALLHALKSAGFGREVAVTVNHMEDGEAYRKLGATLILAPFDDAAEGAVQKIMREAPPELLG
ncbi:MAG: transporter, CPA2 family [Rhodobacteraceae bacterium HLUCCA12]|nr:MAG: transporter, CPA2 family [Rhodobacteraceae bacterium HLUCCA12]